MTTTTPCRSPRLVFALVLLALSATSCVIVRHEDVPRNGDAETTEFDANRYAAERWDTQVLPELEQRSIELVTVLNALATDPDLARQKFGHRSEESAPFSFAIHGTAKVKAVDLESSAATVELALAPPLPGGAVLVQIGPVIRTSALRDALTFVRFGDFTNQVDFANVSRALNTKVKDSVVASLDREHLLGKTLRFTGAFTEDASGRVLITPVRIGVVP